MEATHRQLGPAPGDQRGFVHKRIFGGIKGAVGGILGGPGGVLGGALRGFVKPTGTSLVTTTRAVPATTGCPPGFFFNVNTQQCVPATRLPGGRGGVVGQPVVSEVIRRLRGDTIPDVSPNGTREQLTVGGDAELGRFGAGINPAFFSTQTRRCPRGMVLGAPEADGESLCYDGLTNKERLWPRGRRPLLTGGEMRAISVASSAAKKLQRKTKQLQELGLLPKASKRSRAAGSPVHVRTAGVAHN